MPGRSPQSPSLVVFGDSLSDNGNLFKLIGVPPPPYWNGHFSNGPTYAEQLATQLHLILDDRAFGGAEASDLSVPLFTDPATGNPLPINVSAQVSQFVAQLHDHRAPANQSALINIGSNDYDSYLIGGLPKDPATAQTIVTNVVASTEQAIETLTAAGVRNIILFTLPDFGTTPNAHAAGPAAVAFAHALDVANNASLQQIAQSHRNVQLVDSFQLSEAFFADPTSFGVTANVDNTTLLDLLAQGSTQYAPNEVAFFDGEHPTTAAHGVIAAFADATLTADHTQFLDGTQSVVDARRGNNFIFATPIDPSVPGSNDNYTIHGNRGNDFIYAGSGNVSVDGGAGDDLIAAGSGNATLQGGLGFDLLETNSLGVNHLSGGQGADALVVNRGGNNTMQGGIGDDLFVLKENGGLAKPDGTFSFGPQLIDGGAGNNTLRFIVNDQNPTVESQLIAEFKQVESAFDLAAHDHHFGTFQIDGLQATHIDRLELQVDSVSSDPNTPYQITHGIALTDGHAGHVGPRLGGLLTTAEHWGFLTV